MKSYLAFLASILLVLLIEVECENPDLTLLQEYLRIDTSYPDPDYEAAVAWIKKQSKILNLEYHHLDLPSGTNESGLPVVWLTWRGSNVALDSILLYNHMDVVSVDPKGWTVDPFGGTIIDNKIYARGAQDMKSIAVQQLIAIRDLQANGFKPTRTVHIAFFPDEERGGFSGIHLFIKTPEFKALRIGFALDEGINNEDEFLSIYHTERTVLWVKILMTGTTGHGSLLPNDTAGEKLQKVINRMMNLRMQEKLRLQMDKSLRLGDVTSINLNMLEGGIQENITPPWLSVTFDVRVTPHWDLKEFLQFLNETCTEGGTGITYDLGGWTADPPGATDIANSSWWWGGFQEALTFLKIKLVPRIMPAGTDGRLLRDLGIPVLGMSTIFKSPNLLHSSDEYLELEDFFKGIDIYHTLIQTLAASSSNEMVKSNSQNSGGKNRPPTTNSKKGSSSSGSLLVDHRNLGTLLSIVLLSFALSIV